MEFVKYSDSELSQFTNNVVKSLTKNPAFSSPPITVADLAKVAETFDNAVHAASQGGPPAYVAKNIAREELIKLLRTMAQYVQFQASENLQALMSSGFYASSTNRASVPLETPMIAKVENGTTTKLSVRLNGVANSRAYHLQISANGNGGWQDAGIFTQSRRIVLDHLTPGTLYNIRARAIGGSTGYSEWSDPVSHMST
jgi:hypothetical protein